MSDGEDEKYKDVQDQLSALLNIVRKQSSIQKQQAETQKQLSEWIMSRPSITSENSESTESPRLAAAGGCSAEFLMESISNSIASEFVYDPDNDLTFEKWFSKYCDLFKDDAKKLDEKARLRILLRKLGSREYELYLAFICPKEPQENSFDETVKQLTLRFGLKETVFRSRFNCLKIRKKDDEDYFTYVGRINKSVQRIEYKKMTEEDFKCLLYVAGLVSSSDTKLREKLLNMLEMQKLTDASDTSADDDQQRQRKLRTIHELAVESERYQSLKGDSEFVEKTKAVNKISTQTSSHPQKGRFKKKSKPEDNKSDVPSYPCWTCGDLHYQQTCPFRNHKCSKCNVVGHKNGYCGKKKTTPRKPNNSSNGALAIHNVNLVEHHRKYVKPRINSVFTKLQLDTASDLTIISHDNWKRVGSPKLAKSTIKIRSASGDDVKILGLFTTTIQLNDDVTTSEVYVTTNKALNVFGNQLMSQFKLWSKPIDSVACNKVIIESSEIPSTLKNDFPKVFTTELGCCNKVKATLKLKPDAKPIFKTKRQVAFAKLPLIDEELQRLERAGVIYKVDHSEWAAPIVAVQKTDGRVRLCADYSTGLNNSLEPHHHPLPTSEEIFTKISNNSFFTHIDLSDAYFQVEMDEESQKLLTINTHRGLYRFNRLSQGVKPATGIFQQIADSMLSGTDGTAAFLDDIIIGGKTKEECLQRTRDVLTRLQNYGFTLRIEKCKFLMTQLKYLGLILDSTGLKPDPNKIEAVENLPEPTNVSELRSFLGAINWYRKFIPQMSNLQAPLDELLKKDVKFEWNEKCRQSFVKFKEILKSDLALTHYDPKLPIIVSADASGLGIGAAIQHKMKDGTIKTIAHAARSLNSAEKAYGQIEREALALIFAVKKFHRYIYGRKFTLKTDHKPLLSIFGSTKGVPAHTANRLQRWALILLNYDFSIEYVKTKEFGNVDVLSRLINQKQKPEEDYVIASIQLENDITRSLTESIAKFPLTHIQIAHETKTDEVLKIVFECVMKGNWNDHREDPQVNIFKSRASELSIHQECIMLGDRVVVPSSLRQKVIKQLHRGHPGIVRMKAIARSYVYWPKIDSDVEHCVQACGSCQNVAKSPPIAELHSWPIPTEPWQRIHIDLAKHESGNQLFIIVDAYTKFLEVYVMINITSSAIITALEDCFSRYGNVHTIVSDNGTQFTSSSFKEFCKSNDIEHLTIAPFHPQSNGMAERFVDTVKRGLKKTAPDGKNVRHHLNIFLQTFRSTPNPISGKSPHELMFGRKMRTVLDSLKPPAHHQTVDNIAQNAEFNRRRGAKSRKLSAGDQVFVKIYKNNSFKWVSGEIIEPIGNAMYTVWIAPRQIVRAHINQLRHDKS